MNLSGIISSFALPGGLELTRYEAGFFSHGQHVEGATSEVKVDPIAVYPAKPQDVLALPEGLRSEEALTLLSYEELRAAKAPSGAKGDTFTYGGEDFEIRAVEHWEVAGFYRGVATKVSQ
jgi:hypothetical protein